MVLERKELPTKEDDKEETLLCEICGAVLETVQEKVSRRCARCMSQQT